MMGRTTKKDKAGNPILNCDCCNVEYCGLLNCRNMLISKLASYEDAEEQGRLMVLPCKVGDTIYILGGDVKNGYETVKKTHVEEVPFGLGCLNKQMKLYPLYYLTREEAEKALEGIG